MNNKYRLEHRLGGGAFGNIYAGESILESIKRIEPPNCLHYNSYFRYMHANSWESSNQNCKWNFGDRVWQKQIGTCLSWFAKLFFNSSISFTHAKERWSNQEIIVFQKLNHTISCIKRQLALPPRVHFLNLFFSPQEQQSQQSFNSLQQEFFILRHLQGVKGVPKVYWFGQESKFNILIMERLGQSVDEKWKQMKTGAAASGGDNNERPHEVKLMTLLLTIDQMLDRLRDIHDRCVIHRDIKPENFLFKDTEYDQDEKHSHFEEDYQGASYVEEAAEAKNLNNESDSPNE